MLGTRMLIVLVAVCCAQGCTVDRSYLLRKSAENLKCDRGEITIVSQTENDGGGNFDWVARYKGRDYHCEHRCPAHVCSSTCKETESSNAETQKKVAIDRLSLETGCAADGIRVLSQSEWSSGGEVAYRIEACGKTYVCTQAPGRTECKEALAQ
ncbi:MAG TPA: hypothetical protein PK668_05130 [Myxococcota bacterium]|nr:hypothetical protein [Myxococcota bacterium]HRY92241.1 hypothetical protein [Myxococcota bacterium]